MFSEREKGSGTNGTVAGKASSHFTRISDLFHSLTPLISTDYALRF
jgi:hypothetical protein